MIPKVKDRPSSYCEDLNRGERASHVLVPAREVCKEMENIFSNHLAGPVVLERLPFRTGIIPCMT